MPVDANGVEHGEPEVRAAGAILTDDDGRLAVVWRDHRRDWSLPKGKLEPGESEEQAAVREVAEETGYEGRIVRDLGLVRYRDHRDRAKSVRYFHLAVVEGAFVANDEVAALEWLAPEEATRRLSYDTDRRLVERFRSSAN